MAARSSTRARPDGHFRAFGEKIAPRASLTRFFYYAEDAEVTQKAQKNLEVLSRLLRNFCAFCVQKTSASPLADGRERADAFSYRLTLRR